MRLRKKGHDHNLNALTDFLCNIVGILIIILIVVEVWAGKIISDQGESAANPEVGEAELAQIRDEHGRMQGVYEETKAEWESSRSQTEAMQKELARISALIAELEKRLSGLEGSANDRQLLRQAIEKLNKQKIELERSLASARSDLEKLNVAHSRLLTGKQAGNGIRLPDPHPAAPGAEALIFACRYGRITYMDREKLSSALIGGIQKALGGKKATSLSDLETIGRHFEKNDIGDDLFRWKFYTVQSGNDYMPVGDLIWRSPTAGESLDRIADRNSRYQQALAAAAGKNQYLRFMVWSDSFDTYLTARRAADTAGIAAGWAVFDVNEKFRQNLASSGQGSGGGDVD